MATLTHIDGWEHGLAYIAGTAVNAENSSAQAHSGSNSLRVYTATGAAGYCSVTQLGAVRIKVGLVYVRFGSWPAGDVTIINMALSSGLSHQIRLNATTKKLYACFGGTQNGNTCDVELSLNTWYRIDYNFNANANPNLIDFQVAAGEGAATAATQSSYAQAASYISSNRLGHTELEAFEVFYDDWLQSETAGDYPLGPSGVEARRPNAAGTSAPGSVIYDNADELVDDATNPANYELDDAALNSTSDYIKQTGTGDANYAEVQFEDTAQSTILGVVANVSYHSSGATANSAETRIRDNNGQETVVFLGDMSETSVYQRMAIVSVPSGGWTPSAVNQLRGRVGYATNVASVPYWDALMLQVAYQISSGSNLLKIINE